MDWQLSSTPHGDTPDNVPTDSSPGGGRRNRELGEGRVEEREGGRESTIISPYN